MSSGLQVEQLTCAVGTRTLFSGVDVALPAGAWAMLTGTNGSGKSTLLRALAGLVRPVAGRILWRGVPQQAGDPAWHGHFVYQGHAAGWKDVLSVRENLALQAALDGVAAAGDASALDAALLRAGLGRQRTLAFARLSAGQRRRLGLARLMLGARPLWLLDEPTTALDSAGQALLSELLEQHLARGGCAIVATHQPLPVQAAPVAVTLDAAQASGAPRP